MSDVLTQDNAHAAAIATTHPAHQALIGATLELRERLSRALAIEYDWRYHDGPEWAARYWQAFGDLAAGAREGAEQPGYRRALERERWQPLSRTEADDVRTIFRGLIGLAHPEVIPAASQDIRAEIWPRILRAYRGGDRGALVAAWSEVRALVRKPALPANVVTLRAEYRRLGQAVGAVDRRLAEMSQSFPFNMRDKLADARWVHQQRLALAQVKAFIERPSASAMASRARTKSVS